MDTHELETVVDRFTSPRGDAPARAPAPEGFVATRGWTCMGPRPSGPPLSPREREILNLVNGGKTRKEVAYDLGVTHSTVRVLYSRAMKKLGGSWRPARF